MERTMLDKGGGEGHESSENGSCMCDYCEIKTNQVPAGHQNEMEHKMRKLYSCESCDFKSGHSSAVKRHKENLHLKGSQTKHKCGMCDYETLYKSALKRHVANKHNRDSLMSFKCSFCDYVSTYEFAIERHMSTVHIKNKEGEHCCKLCDYSTMHKHSLDRHIRIVHEREMKYKCDQCSFKTGHKSALRMHAATIHMAKKAYRCVICGYETLYKTALMRHRNTVNCKTGCKVVGAGNILRQEQVGLDPASSQIQEEPTFVTLEDSDDKSFPKPIFVNASSIDLPAKSQVGFNTSVVFSTDPITGITILDKDCLFYPSSKYKAGDVITVTTAPQ